MASLAILYACPPYRPSPLGATARAHLPFAPPSPLSSLLPANYGLTVLAGASTFILHLGQMLVVDLTRTKAGIAYPQCESTRRV